MSGYEWLGEAKEFFDKNGGNNYSLGDESSQKAQTINQNLQSLMKSGLENSADIILNTKGSKWCVQGQNKISEGIWYRSYHKDFGSHYPVVFGAYLGSDGLSISIQIYNNIIPDSSLLEVLGELIETCVKDNGLVKKERGGDKEPYSDFGFFDVQPNDVDENIKKVLEVYEELPKKISQTIFNKMIKLYLNSSESHRCQIAKDNERYKKRLNVKSMVDDFINKEPDEELFRKFWNREIINCVQQGASAGNVIERNGGIKELHPKLKTLIELEVNDDILSNIQGCISSSKNSSLELYYLYHMAGDTFPLINGGIKSAINIIKKNQAGDLSEDILNMMETLKEKMPEKEGLSKYYLLDQFLNLIDKIKYEDIQGAGDSKELYQLAYLFTFFRKVNQVNNANFFDDLLQKAKNIVLYGAPGTGKTFTSENNIRRIIEDDFPNADIAIEDRFQKVQFHPSYSYEDFMEGLKPVMKNGNVALELKQGDFFKFCEFATSYQDRFENADLKDKLKYAFFFLIDEINRAELSRVFGEIMYALDKRGNGIRTQYSYLKEGNKEFVIPKNVYLIGTMNDVDKSIDSFDLALRRRFFWYRMDCDYEVIKSELNQFENIGAFNSKDVPDSGYLKSCYDLNQYITQSDNNGLGLGKLYELGHSYFMSIESHAKKGKIKNNNMQDLFEFSISPLLKEYLRSEYSEEKVEEKLIEAKRKFVLPKVK